MTAIEPGQPAPDFTLPADDGRNITLSALRPAPVVLYFYPRDDTPGCTTEALEFSALMPAFRALGAEVFGISKDTLEKHAKFRRKHDLSVPLLSDAQGHVCEDYGAWGEKRMYGRTFQGITRTTVLIDGTGKIAHVWHRVRPKGHAAEVLAALRTLPAAPDTPGNGSGS